MKQAILMITAVISITAIVSSCNANKNTSNRCKYKGHEDVLFRTPDQMPSEEPNIGWVFVNAQCQIDSFYDGSTAVGISPEDFSNGHASIKLDGKQPITVEQFTPYDPQEDQ